MRCSKVYPENHKRKSLLPPSLLENLDRKVLEQNLIPAPIPSHAIVHLPSQIKETLSNSQDFICPRLNITVWKSVLNVCDGGGYKRHKGFWCLLTISVAATKLFSLNVLFLDWIRTRDLINLSSVVSKRFTYLQFCLWYPTM